MDAQLQIRRQIFPQATRVFESNDLQRIAITEIPLHSVIDNNPSAAVTIKDYTLASKQQLFEHCTSHSTWTIIPVAGTVEYSINSKSPNLLDPGEALEFNGCAGETIALTNPFESELINFVVIETTDFPQRPESDWVTSLQSWDTSLQSGTRESRTQSEVTTVFDINGSVNNLILIESYQPGYRVCIGKFGGREAKKFTPSAPGNSTVFYVVEGAFEAAECLLEDRDALLLDGFNDVDFETLSNNAILLVIELPPDTI